MKEDVPIFFVRINQIIKPGVAVPLSWFMIDNFNLAFDQILSNFI